MKPPMTTEQTLVTLPAGNHNLSIHVKYATWEPGDVVNFKNHCCSILIRLRDTVVARWCWGTKKIISTIPSRLLLSFFSQLPLRTKTQTSSSAHHATSQSAPAHHSASHYRNKWPNINHNVSEATHIKREPPVPMAYLGWKPVIKSVKMWKN